MKQEIRISLAKVKEAIEKEGSYPFLQEIAQSLEAMITGESLPRERRLKMAGALERLVIEDFHFSESPLGEELLKIADKFSEL